MCLQHEDDDDQNTKGRSVSEGVRDKQDRQQGASLMPNWQEVTLPPKHVLGHLTDAHCHPTDLTHKPEIYDEVPLGGLASMGTTVEDQEKVYELGRQRGWKEGSISRGIKEGVKVVSCFVYAPLARARSSKLQAEPDKTPSESSLKEGYHPWFSHRYTLVSPQPSKMDHYSSIFFPPSSTPDNPKRAREREMLESLLPFFPDPISFAPLLDGMRRDITRCREERRLVMVGEVGLDGAARVRWPVGGRRLYDETTRSIRADHKDFRGMKRSVEGNGVRTTERKTPVEGMDIAGHEKSSTDDDDENDNDNDDAWKRLSPFKISIQHQKAILRAQMEIAVDFGIPISLHCVAAPGHTIDILREMRDTHGPRFTNRVNVDLHSGGGWTSPFWTQASKHLSNLYASPSVLITGRLTSPDDLIRAIQPDRILVESDSHDVRRGPRLVWAAAVWVADVKKWKLEGRDELDGKGGEEWGEESMVESEEEWIRRNGRKAAKRRTGRVGPEQIGIETQNGREEGMAEGAKGTKETKEADGGVAQDIWTVRTLERNWARFMGLIGPYE